MTTLDVSRRMNVDKKAWTHNDFPEMGWHDCPIYGIQFNDTVLLDIDYILKWVLDEETKHYRFWISPVTLEFIAPSQLKLSVELDFINGLEIADIKQTFVSRAKYRYEIETQEGDIELVAEGFNQIIRKDPIFVQNQFLTEEQRGGYLFSHYEAKEC